MLKNPSPSNDQSLYLNNLIAANKYSLIFLFIFDIQYNLSLIFRKFSKK